MEEARLVDRLDRAESHRHRRELPEIRHEPRVRIRRDALAVDFLAEHVELRFREPPLEERARIDAGRRVPLDVEEVAAVILARAVPEMVEADVVERRGRCEARDVTAELEILLPARSTIATAFQRTSERRRASIS
jgi:hypothetical protein